MCAFVHAVEVSGNTAPVDQRLQTAQNWNRAVTTEARQEERTPLREERERLATERAELQAEVTRLEASGDVDTLRALAARPHRHVEALHAFHDALEAFHQRFGPLGPYHTLTNSGIGLTRVP